MIKRLLAIILLGSMPLLAHAESIDSQDSLNVKSSSSRRGPDGQDGQDGRDGVCIHTQPEIEYGYFLTYDEETLDDGREVFWDPDQAPDAHTSGIFLSPSDVDEVILSRTGIYLATFIVTAHEAVTDGGSGLQFVIVLNDTVIPSSSYARYIGDGDSVQVHGQAVFLVTEENSDLELINTSEITVVLDPEVRSGYPNVAASIYIERLADLPLP